MGARNINFSVPHPNQDYLINQKKKKKRKEIGHATGLYNFKNIRTLKTRNQKSILQMKIKGHKISVVLL